MRIEDLSVNERTLIHLKDFSMDPEREGASLGQTQEGIAKAIGIRINHVPRATNALIQDGYISQALVHVGGLKRRRKAFFLTDPGLKTATQLISKLNNQKVKFRDSSGKERSVAVGELLYGGRQATASSVILTFFRDGVVLESSLGGGDGTPHISMLDALQEPEMFVDREKELKALRDRMGSGERLVVVSGMKGIGKTSLVWKALKDLEGRKNIFWYTAHDWDTMRSMLEQFSEFFVRLGRNETKRALRQFKSMDVGQASSAILRDMHDSESIAVIDGVFDLKKEVMQLLYTLCEQSRNLENASIILITRDRDCLCSTPCLSDLGAKDLVLKGLDHSSATKLMESLGMDPEDTERVFAMTQGHPLAIRLVNSEEINRTIDTKGLTREEVWVVRCMKAFHAIFGD